MSKSVIFTCDACGKETKYVNDFMSLVVDATDKDVCQSCLRSLFEDR